MTCERLTTAQADLVAEHHYLATHAAVQAARRWPATDKGDLLSYAFLGLIDAARAWDPDRGTTFVGYARHIIKHRIVDEWRRDHGRHGVRLVPFLEHDDGTVDERPLAVDEPGFESVLDHLHAAATIATVGLTDRERHVLVQLGEGRSLQAVAEDLGVDESRISQIRRAVRDRLPEFAHEPATRRCVWCSAIWVPEDSHAIYCRKRCRMDAKNAARRLARGEPKGPYRRRAA